MARSTPSAAKKAAPAGNAEPARTDAGKIAKTQIVDMVADRTSLNKKQAGDAVATVIDCIVDALRTGSSVGLPGLGTLSIAQTAERSGVRPGTSDRITIPAGKKVRFKVATTLKGTL
ncbi:HU family DNA-binding protein [Deinococcus taeanensis]|uniref:HU family DNA-binding protein n=1 Tax=Deinococcus taeanensis TaxID=2737050 RepID=UPI001CDCB713|nr:HU family DNA-binding protein [Deinococcus taeanensis]UBV42463.1 HU family DNA-binding protein [Deinococcus taeanensis]